MNMVVWDKRGRGLLYPVCFSLITSINPFFIYTYNVVSRKSFSGIFGRSKIFDQSKDLHSTDRISSTDSVLNLSRNIEWSRIDSHLSNWLCRLHGFTLSSYSQHLPKRNHLCSCIIRWQNGFLQLLQRKFCFCTFGSMITCHLVVGKVKASSRPTSSLHGCTFNYSAFDFMKSSLPCPNPF